MSTNLETVQKLIALGGEASQLEATVGDDGFAHWWTPGKGSTPIEFTPGPRDDSENNPYRPLTFTGEQSPFIVAAVNARPAIAGLVAEVERFRDALIAIKDLRPGTFEHYDAGRKAISIAQVALEKE